MAVRLCARMSLSYPLLTLHQRFTSSLYRQHLPRFVFVFRSVHKFKAMPDQTKLESIINNAINGRIYCAEIVLLLEDLFPSPNAKAMKIDMARPHAAAQN